MSTADLIDMVTDPADSNTNPAASDDELDDVEEVVAALSLKDARRYFKALATFVADNTEYTAQDELYFQRLSDKAAKMLVTRINQRQQQSITSYFSNVVS